MKVTIGNYNEKSTYILGVDFARTGKDETAYVVLERLPFSEDVYIVYIETQHTPDLNMAITKVMYLNQVFRFKCIICDETGLGAGPTDILKRKLSGKVRGIWYTNKSKNDMFNNLKLLMGGATGLGKLYIPDYNTTTNPNVRKMFYQFLAIIQEPSKNSDTIKIYHEPRQHDDIVNAVALAATFFNVKKGRKKYPFLGLL